VRFFFALILVSIFLPFQAICDAFGTGDTLIVDSLTLGVEKEEGEWPSEEYFFAASHDVKRWNPVNRFSILMGMGKSSVDLSPIQTNLDSSLRVFFPTSYSQATMKSIQGDFNYSAFKKIGLGIGMSYQTWQGSSFVGRPPLPFFPQKGKPIDYFSENGDLYEVVRIHIEDQEFEIDTILIPMHVTSWKAFKATLPLYVFADLIPKSNRFNIQVRMGAVYSKTHYTDFTYSIIHLNRMFDKYEPAFNQVNWGAVFECRPYVNLTKSWSLWFKISYYSDKIQSPFQELSQQYQAPLWYSTGMGFSF
jgi:hypothetical protein